MMKGVLLVACLALLCGLGRSCSKTKPCECIESNFTINLGDVSNEIEGKNISDPSGDKKYVFLLSLCKPIVCTFTKGVTENKTAAACQYSFNQKVFAMLGAQSTIEWEVSPAEETRDFHIMYTGGTPISGGKDDGHGRRTRVDFIIDNSVKKPVAVFDQEITDDQADNGDPYHTYVFKVTMSSKYEDKGLGGSIAGVAGLVIMLLLIIAIAAYCIIGAVVMYKVKGARGAEVIPQYAFWKELPIYIKDGFLFTISPCRKKFGSGYQSL